MTKPMKPGEIREFNGRRYKAVERPLDENRHCKGCVFSKLPCGHSVSVLGSCSDVYYIDVTEPETTGEILDYTWFNEPGEIVKGTVLIQSFIIEALDIIVGALDCNKMGYEYMELQEIIKKLKDMINE